MIAIDIRCSQGHLFEGWFDNLEALQNYQSLLKSRAVELKPLLDDNKNFIDTSKQIYFFAEEHVIFDRQRNDFL